MKAFRAAIFHLLSDPTKTGDQDAFEYWDDGGLLVDDGHVVAVGPWGDVERQLPNDAVVTRFDDALIMPGFVDTHVHYPQIEVIASYGVQLLDWLKNYTFPAEQKFADATHASAMSDFFLEELLKNGTTCALIFSTVHKQATDILFQAAQKLRMRIIAGKSLMDRNAPEALCDTAETGYADSADLIKKWHGRDRLAYAVTPRFAVTSTPEQLSAAGRLVAENPGVYMQTHLSENEKEVDLIKELFPNGQNYLSVYDDAGLLCDHSVFAHCIHLEQDEFERLGNAGAGIAFCPTSNLFLGSGLFDLKRALAHDIKVGLGTDVGGGTSFSMFQTMGEAYKVCQMRGAPLDPLNSIYLATLGGAKTLNLDDKIGNLCPGKEADFIVVDPHSSPLISHRYRLAQSPSEKMFVLNILGDDRLIKSTYVLGEAAYERNHVSSDQRTGISKTSS